MLQSDLILDCAANPRLHDPSPLTVWAQHVTGPRDIAPNEEDMVPAVRESNGAHSQGEGQTGYDETQ